MQNISHLRIGDYHVFPLEFALQYLEQEKVHIQPKFIDVLIYLADQYPRIVPRQELIDSVWNGNNYVGEKALTNAIWHLRKHLKTDSQGEEIIETIRKTGYRLLVKPKVVQLESVINKGLLQNKQEDQQNLRRNLKLLPIFGAASLMIFLLWHYFYTPKTVDRILIETVTTDPGRELFPAPSPDGRYIVYKWIKPDEQINLYMRDLQQPQIAPIQLTFDDLSEGHSVWSNDGRYIFFSRKNIPTGDCEIVRLSIANKQENKLTNCPKSGGYYYLDISPDDRTLAFHGNDADATMDSGIYFLDLIAENSQPVRFSCEQDCGYRDRDFAFSPDGTQLAVTRRAHSVSENIFLVDIQSKQTKTLTEGFPDIVGLTWHPGGKQIVFGAQQADHRSGYLLDLATGKIESLHIDGFSYPAFSKQNPELFFQLRQEKYHIASFRLEESMPTSPFPVLLSEFSHRNPHYSEVHNKIVYSSNESGQYELWTADINGENRQQITHLNMNILYPRWSHDGKKIAFLVLHDQPAGDQIYWLDVATNKINELHTPYHSHDRPSWSSNDQSIITAIYREDEVDLFEFDLAGNSSKRLTQDGGRFGVISENNELIYSRYKLGLWQKKLTESNENILPTQLISEKDFKTTYAWNNSKQGIYFRQNVQHHQQIYYYQFDSQTIESVVKLPGRAYESLGVPVLVADEQQLLFTLEEMPQANIKRMRHPLFEY